MRSRDAMRFAVFIARFYPSQLKLTTISSCSILHPRGHPKAISRPSSPYSHPTAILQPSLHHLHEYPHDHLRGHRSYPTASTAIPWSSSRLFQSHYGGHGGHSRDGQHGLPLYNLPLPQARSLPYSSPLRYHHFGLLRSAAYARAVVLVGDACGRRVCPRRAASAP